MQTKFKTSEQKTARLRELFNSGKILLAPGCFNPVSGVLIEKAGFDAIYISGAGVAVNNIGYPDIGLTTMTEILDNARNVVNVTNLPVICDIDTGYGNPLNVVRTVRDFENAGVAGLQMEDQIIPKKCGHIAGKGLVSKQEMVQKIKAAVDTRRDTNLTIFARTDAIAVEGLDAAIERSLAYKEAGADVTFVEAPGSLADMKKITSSIPGLHMANMVEKGGSTPIMPPAELQELGFHFVIYPGSTWMAAIKSIEEVLQVLKEDGTTERYYDRMVPFHEKGNELFETVRLSDWRKIEARYTS
ncbi:2,3-dimethylmalate lyase [Variovorax sp. PBS-H4]|uniref:isocitrate lyase/PEP mutase family protein n=1 Tax=Variovorax sp. PBS-H4 TaxID=434008 RepID=UPI0013169994|nr:isocitrate lyase/phosphoenolpyruvate mutase family protein [Variovorax sp. PBS-H4]VTU41319.1 2,3-dimethylmalate lyase [Variovorax sp. PBS-H4]